MSIQAMVWAIAQDIQQPATKLLLICLANYADKEGTAYPSQKTLSIDASMSESSVRRHLKELEVSGLIARSTQRRGDGTRASDFYALAINRSNSKPQPVKLTGGHQPVKSGHINRSLVTGTREPSLREPILSQKEGNLGKVVVGSTAHASLRSVLAMVFPGRRSGGRS